MRGVLFALYCKSPLSERISGLEFQSESLLQPDVESAQAFAHQMLSPSIDNMNLIPACYHDVKGKTMMVLSLRLIHPMKQHRTPIRNVLPIGERRVGPRLTLKSDNAETNPCLQSAVLGQRQEFHQLIVDTIRISLCVPLLWYLRGVRFALHRASGSC